ncbi:taste receptor type 2 member 14-like [Ochotona curzoniae]|uniref:taste receptor type 2 member 14-like n=1 Tax=Ochotona curzoniae TaxID=130825 RepID=UPI001B34A36D|nr:taste receptor type 2 member 14-like [Ochotona curzoniae]
MAGVVLTILTLILSAEFIIGNAGNGLIVFVNCVDWVKRRKISLIDRITTALAISRIGLVWYMFLTELGSLLLQDLMFDAKMSKLTYIIGILVNHLSMWIATSLSVFYFLKIANFSHSTFLFLKWRVEKVISVLLFVSLVLLILHIAASNIYIGVWMGVYKGNVSYMLSPSTHAFKNFLCIETLFTFIPFSLSLITFLLLIFSLWRHLRNVQLSALGCRDARTKAHLQGLQTVVMFLILYTIFFLMLLLQMWNTYFGKSQLSVILCHVFGMIYPSGHSCVMILGNNKLRQASLAVLCWLRCKAKETEP